MNTSRRTFVIGCLAAPSLLVAGRASAAAPLQKLDESDQAARQYSYRHDATKVEANRYPTYKIGQTCANCSLFEGQAKDAWGGCLIFGTKQVAATGWCDKYTNA